MKITKYPQSCILVETKGKKILIDPGTLKYKEEYFDIWNNVDAIFVTHKHGDHCNSEVLSKINKEIPIYSTTEVQETYPILNITVIKENDILDMDGVRIEVVHAIHGYNPMLKGKAVKENVGYIIDDGLNRIYITSDTICFENEYKSNILCVPVTGFGLTMTAFEAALYSKDVGAKTTILTHMDNQALPPDYDYIDKMFKRFDVEYKILDNEETIVIQ